MTTRPGPDAFGLPHCHRAFTTASALELFATWCWPQYAQSAPGESAASVRADMVRRAVTSDPDAKCRVEVESDRFDRARSGGESWLAQCGLPHGLRRPWIARTPQNGRLYDQCEGGSSSIGAVQTIRHRRPGSPREDGQAAAASATQGLLKQSRTRPTRRAERHRAPPNGRSCGEQHPGDTPSVRG